MLRHRLQTLKNLPKRFRAATTGVQQHRILTEQNRNSFYAIGAAAAV